METATRLLFSTCLSVCLHTLSSLPVGGLKHLTRPAGKPAAAPFVVWGEGEGEVTASKQSLQRFANNCEDL